MPDEEYPFILTTGRVLEHWHGGTLTRHSKLDDLYPEARIEINPADAARLKIEDGQAVRVSSRRGTDRPARLGDRSGRPWAWSLSPCILPKPPPTCSPSTPWTRWPRSPSTKPAPCASSRG